MPNKDEISAAIQAIEPFKQSDELFKSRMAAHARVLSVEKGQVLFVNQDKADKIYIVLSGWVKLFRETLDGTQAVIDIIPKNHMFGETSIFEDCIYPYSAEATETSELISLPISLLKDGIETDPKLALAMLSSMAKYRKQQDREIEHRTIQNASQRIGCFLLRLIDQDQQGPVSIHLPYDKTLVASRLGMQPETFSRALKKLKDATGIDVKGATVHMDDVQQLVRYSCAACSAEFPCKDLKVSAY